MVFFRSRTKNMMWYGVLGTKELLHRTYKNLEQRVLLEVRYRTNWSRLLVLLVLLPTSCYFSSRWRQLTHNLCVCVCVCVRAQCDGRPIPLPSLQGIAVLNIPSYAGGTNFWGGTKEDDVRTDPVCLFVCLSVSLSICLTVCLSACLSLRRSQLRPLMIRSWRWWPCSAACRWPCPESSTCSTTASHRYTCLSVRLSVCPPVCLPVCPSRCLTLSVSLSQCRTVKITILGDEGVPVQVDGEAWVQPPGYIKIIHKNRTQTLTRDRVSTNPHPHEY